MRTGTAYAPLHGGHCPPWLFEKMKELGAVMIEVIAIEYGSTEVLRRLSDPIWFQALGSVLGFDWHSSGLTTVLCGALKEGLYERQGELGLFFAGGKGKASRKTPEEIISAGEKYALPNDLAELQRTSRMVAKVDSAAVQDGYQLYHHFFVFDRDGNWAVVQQGMNEKNRYARRYHWLSETLQSFTEDPHQAVCGKPATGVLNLVSRHNVATRLASVELCHERPESVVKILKSIHNIEKEPNITKPQQLTLFDESPVYSLDTEMSGNQTVPSIIMPSSHPIPSTRYLDKILHQLYEHPIETYENLLETPGVGPSTLRALSMVAEVTHGAQPSFTDPVRYAFAHGGKDNYPFPVSRQDLEHSLGVLRTAVEKAKMGNQEKMEALRRLSQQGEKLYQL